LKVARDAPDIVIRAAYKSLSQRFHPDKNPGDERAARIMALINQSYDILCDPKKRREHDSWIEREEARIGSTYAAQGSAAPIPPQWRTPEPPPQADEPRRNILALLLLWPFKLLLKIFLAAPRLVALGLILGGFALYDAVTPDPPPPPGPKPYTATPVAQAVKPTYTRPAMAPNGAPWPSRASYVADYPVLSTDGLSEVTVDNGQNSSDVFVKLVSLDGSKAFPVRQFFIPAHDRFMLDHVSPGNYDVRYRDLSSGGLSRSEAFLVEQEPTYDGTQYSSITMTLYKVQGGNFQTYDLAESEF
jgi:hypothetical protein